MDDLTGAINERKYSDCLHVVALEYISTHLNNYTKLERKPAQNNFRHGTKRVNAEIETQSLLSNSEHRVRVTLVHNATCKNTNRKYF